MADKKVDYVWLVQYEHGGIPEEPEAYSSSGLATAAMSHMLEENGWPRKPKEWRCTHVNEYDRCFKDWSEKDFDFGRKHTFDFEDDTIRMWHVSVNHA